RLVRFELLGFEEPHVVGRHHRGAAAAGERERAGNVGLLERPAEALQLEVEATGKQREPRIECALGVGLAGMNQRAADVALGCTGQADQALEMRGPKPAAPCCGSPAATGTAGGDESGAAPRPPRAPADPPPPAA